MHHEFFHLMQGTVLNDQYFKDPDWAALNAPRTQYAAPGAASQRDDMYELRHPAEGFINKYSQSAVEEDMAEIFAALFVEEESTKVLEWAERDAALRAKVERMRSLIADYSASATTTTTKPAP
jgi:hypothetical protein